MPDSLTVAAETGPDDGSSAPAEELQGEDALGPRPRVRKPSRRVITLISIPLVAAVIGSYVGDALAPDLVNRNPLLLLILNPRNRNLLLITNQLDTVTYYVAGTLRLLATDPLWYLLGIWYGESALQWAERRTRTFGETLRWMERGFAKAAYPLVFIAPNNWICLFAGAAGMGVVPFLVLNVGGTVFRLWLLREVGEVFESPIDGLLGFIADYRVPLLIASFVAVGIMIAMEYRKGGGEITTLTHLDEELETGGTPGSDVPAPDAPGSDDEPG
jgi:membrane protein DedA with SNARE-associated domain